MMYRIWDRIDNKNQEEILQQAEKYLQNINDL